MQIVLIEWEDSSHGQPGWQYSEDACYDTMKMHSAGFLFRETKDKVVIVPHINADQVDFKQIAGYMVIPKRSILKRITLKK